MATPCNCDTFTGTVTIDGSLGIGTAAPAGVLDVAGSGGTVAAYVGPASDDYGAVILRGGTSGTYWELAKLRSVDVTPDGFSLQAVNGSSVLPVLVASLTGQVGIGTTAPTELLHLQGGSLYINGGNILVSGDVTTGVGAFYATTTKVADSGGCYYGN